MLLIDVKHVGFLMFASLKSQAMRVSCSIRLAGLTLVTLTAHFIKAKSLLGTPFGVGELL